MIPKNCSSILVPAFTERSLLVFLLCLNTGSLEDLVHVRRIFDDEHRDGRKAQAVITDASQFPFASRFTMTSDNELLGGEI